MVDFITAEELRNRTTVPDDVKKKKEYELQHRIIEYRLNKSERPWIIVPTDLRPEIRDELKAVGYLVERAYIKSGRYSYGGYIGSDGLLNAKVNDTTFFVYTYLISWKFWADIVNHPNEK